MTLSLIEILPGTQDYVPLNLTLELCDPSGGRCCQNESANILPDSFLENNETFMIQMSSDDPRVNITQPAVTIIIINDDSKQCFT